MLFILTATNVSKMCNKDFTLYYPKILLHLPFVVFCWFTICIKDQNSNQAIRSMQYCSTLITKDYCWKISFHVFLHEIFLFVMLTVVAWLKIWKQSILLTFCILGSLSFLFSLGSFKVCYILLMQGKCFKTQKSKFL